MEPIVSKQLEAATPRVPGAAAPRVVNDTPHAVQVPISEFGGIQEAMASAGREAYIILAATELTNAVIDNHEATR